VPSAVAYHRGAASFGPTFGEAGCQWLALRNTLLFQWKNLRHPPHVARHLLALPVRLVFRLGRDRCVNLGRSAGNHRALWGALSRVNQLRFSGLSSGVARSREREYFRRFLFPGHGWGRGRIMNELPTISAAIIAQNEAAQLPGLLAAVELGR